MTYYGRRIGPGDPSKAELIAMVTRSTPEASEAELRQETRTALRTRLLTEAACQHLVMHEATVYLTEGEEWACTVCDAKWLASLASGGGES